MIRQVSTLLLLLTITLGVAIAQEPTAELVLKGLQSPDSEARMKALEQASDLVYSLEDATDAARIREQLLKLLEDESLADVRWFVASTFENYLSRKDSSTADFLKALPLLQNEDEQVRRYIWMGFGQQVSQPHLTPKIKDELLRMIDHSNKGVAMEAMSWAISASNSREQGRDFVSKALLEFESRLSHQDPDIRNLAVYGILSHYRDIPDKAIEVIGAHLDDSHGDTRSLVLDFLEQNSLRNERLHVLAPKILARFEARPANPDFPQVADAELGPAAGPPMSETFRLARILVVMGAETPSVDEFLMSQVGVRALQGRLFELAAIKGREGRPLLAAILKETGLKAWIRGFTTFMAVGLPASHVPELLEVLEDKRRKLEADPNEFEYTHRSTNLLVVLAKAEPAEPERTEAVLRSFFDVAAVRPKVAAFYAATELFPDSELTKGVADRLVATDWKDFNGDPEYLVLAAYNLREEGHLKPFEVPIAHVDLGPIFKWIVSGEAKEIPNFVKEFAEGDVRIDNMSGVGNDLMALQLRWLVANPQPQAQPGLDKLVTSKRPEIARLAKEALQKLP